MFKLWVPFSCQLLLCDDCQRLFFSKLFSTIDLKLRRNEGLALASEIPLWTLSRFVNTATQSTPPIGHLPMPNCHIFSLAINLISNNGLWQICDRKWNWYFSNHQPIIINFHWHFWVAESKALFKFNLTEVQLFTSNMIYVLIHYLTQKKNNSRSIFFSSKMLFLCHPSFSSPRSIVEMLEKPLLKAPVFIYFRAISIETFSSVNSAIEQLTTDKNSQLITL